MSTLGAFATVQEAAADIREGRIVVVRDSPERENEADLVVAGEHATPATINFMATHARGLIALAMPATRCDELGLRLIASTPRSPLAAPFTTHFEARDGITTGISAQDRATTIQVASNPSRGPDDLVQPGHVVGLRAHPRGVLERPGHTEAAVDLAGLAGLQPTGVVCQILGDDGEVARGATLARFCAHHRLKLLAVDDLVAHLRQRAPLDEVATMRVPTSHGVIEARAYHERGRAGRHLVFMIGDLDACSALPVEVHCEDWPIDALDAALGGGPAQVRAALARISRLGRGMVICLGPPGGAPDTRPERRATRHLAERLLARVGIEPGAARLHLSPGARFSPNQRGVGEQVDLLDVNGAG